MAQQIINIGTSANKGDGDPLRLAFDKVNDNFTELYAGLGSGSNSGSSSGSSSGSGQSVQDGQTVTVDVQGSLLADDSTVAFNSATGEFTGDFTGNATLTNLTANGVIDFTNARIDFAGAQFSNLPTPLYVDIVGSVFADDSTLLVDGVNGTIDASNLTGVLPALDGSNLINIPAGTANSLVGDMKGSVFADDSTLLVDGVNGTLNATALTGALPAIDGSALTGVQSALVSGTNIKTINGQSLLGSGNITISGGSGGGSAFTNIGVGADDSTIRTISEGESFLILGGTGINTSSDAEGNITIDMSGGALEGSSLQPADETTASTQGTTLELSGGDSTGLNSDGGDLTLVGGNGSSGTHGDISIGGTQTGTITIGSGTNFVDFPSGTNVDFSGATVTGLTVTGDVTGSVFADDSTLLVDGVNGTVNISNQSIDDLSDVDTTTIAPSRSMQPLIWDDIDQNWYAGNGISLTSILTMEDNSFIMLRENAYLNFEGSSTDAFDTKLDVVNPTANRTIRLPDADGTVAIASTTLAGYGITDAYTKAEVDSSIADVTAGHFDFNITGDDSTVRTVSSGSTIGIVGGTGITTASDADGNITITASGGGGGSGLQSRSTATGTTSSLADAAEADLDITGFKSYALLSITTDRAARVRLYVTDATRTADASRAEGVDPTSDAGLIAEVITTGAETVIISPGAFGFNLESSPTTTIPCRVTNKSGSTSTVQVDLNILQLEA